MKENVKIAVIVGGTNTKLVVIAKADKRIYEKSFDTLSGDGKQLMLQSQNASDRKAFTLEHWNDFLPHREQYLNKLAVEIKQACSELEKKEYEASFIGISTPGAVHPKTGEIIGKLGALNLPAWGEFNLAREIESKTWVTTFSANDAKAMALGTLLHLNDAAVTFRSYNNELIELNLGEISESLRNFMEIDPGTGLGGAFVIDRKIWFGKDEKNPDPTIGEIWHFIIDKKYPDKNFEELASGRAAFSRIQQSFKKIDSPEIINELDKCNGKIQELLKTKSKQIRKIVLDEIISTGKYIARGAQYLMRTELPRLQAPSVNTVIIGGGMVSGKSPEGVLVRSTLYSAVRAEFIELKEDAENINIIFTILGSDAGIYGSAHLSEYKF